MTALAVVEEKNTDLISFDESKIDLIKRTVAKGATDDELELFLHQARKMGLDPLARQIHFQKFKSKNGAANVSFITTIDGYRLVADRTGRYAGNSEPVFEGQINSLDWGPYDKVKPVPAKATVTVKKIVGGAVCEFSSTVFWHEYYPGGNKGHMWRKMPCVMLAKCAEAAALRKAFPADLSGVYTFDEMAQSNVVIGDSQAELKKLPPIPVEVHVDENGEPVYIEDGEFIEEKSEPTEVKTGQFHAAGMALCNNSKTLWREYRKTVVKGLTDGDYESSSDLTQEQVDKGTRGMATKKRLIDELWKLDDLYMGDLNAVLEEKDVFPLYELSVKEIKALTEELKGAEPTQPPLVEANGKGAYQEAK